MKWQHLRPAPCNTFHVDLEGQSAYPVRFDEVLPFHPPGLAPVIKDGIAWHINAAGDAAYSRRFLKTFGFYDAIAAVSDESGWHHINVLGEDIYPQRYSWCGNLQEQRCPVRDFDGSYHHINANGSALSNDRWRYAGDYRHGIAVVQGENGLSTHINAKGQLIHGRWFLDVDIYHKGYARARDVAGWMHVDGEGIPLYEQRFSMVEPFYNGQARVECFDGRLQVISVTGSTLVTLRPPLESEFAALSADMVGFWKTQTLAAAVALGIPDVLPLDVPGIAEHCTLHPSRLGRLLRALEELCIVETRSGLWQLTPRGQFLRRDHNMTLADAALEYAGPLSSLWSSLAEALGRDCHWKAPDIFGDIARSPDRITSHHRMLRSYALHDYAAVATNLNLDGTEHILDAGGGLGTLANYVLDTYPGVTVTVLDRPEVILHGVKEQPARDRLQWQACDLFAPWSTRGDAVIFSRVLHDWDDEDAIKILRQAKASLVTGGRLFVVEMLLPETGGNGGQCDLHLLMATGGKERTERQYREIIEKADFKILQVKQLPALPSLLIGVAN